MAAPHSDTIAAPPATEVPEGVPNVGDVVAEKYKVERILGMGGMGVVLAVRHLALGELYAMKFLLPKVATDGDAVLRFMREARAAVRIKSEHISRVSDVGQIPGGSPYIVMEYLHGIDLAKLTESSGGQTPALAASYLVQACAGVAEAHQLGIVHRDLKPSNLFLTQRSDGTPLVKVLDFGISKATADSGPTITATQEVFGSPAYMSPEQIRSAKNVDARCDIWALGVILFELITGKLPFVGETSAGLLAAIMTDPPLTLGSFRPDVKDGLEDVVRRCLEKNPAKRFASIGELATALAPYADADSQSLVQRIVRISSSSLRPPITSIPAPPPSDAELAPTERSWATHPAKVDPQKKASRVIVFAAMAVIAAGTALALKLQKSQPLDPQPTTTTPSLAASAGEASGPSLPDASATPSAAVAGATSASAPRPSTRRPSGKGSVGRPPESASPAVLPSAPQAAPAPTYGDPFGTAH